MYLSRYTNTHTQYVIHQSTSDVHSLSWTTAGRRYKNDLSIRYQQSPFPVPDLLVSGVVSDTNRQSLYVVWCRCQTDEEKWKLRVVESWRAYNWHSCKEKEEEEKENRIRDQVNSWSSYDRKVSETDQRRLNIPTVLSVLPFLPVVSIATTQPGNTDPNGYYKK